MRLQLVVELMQSGALAAAPEWTIFEVASSESPSMWSLVDVAQASVRRARRRDRVSDVTVKRVDEMARTFGGAFVLARASLGVSSFGLQLLDLPAGWEGPEHAHEGMTGERAAMANDGQEEVYFALQGSAVLRLDDGEVALEPGVMVRCGAGQTRQLLTREHPAQVLAIGGVPGGGYTPPAFTELPEGSDS